MQNCSPENIPSHQNAGFPLPCHCWVSLANIFKNVVCMRRANNPDILESELCGLTGSVSGQWRKVLGQLVKPFVGRNELPIKYIALLAKLTYSSSSSLSAVRFSPRWSCFLRIKAILLPFQFGCFLLVSIFSRYGVGFPCFFACLVILDWMPDMIFPWGLDIFVGLDICFELCSGCWKQSDPLESDSENLLRGLFRCGSHFFPHTTEARPFLLSALPDASIPFCVVTQQPSRLSPPIFP